MGIIYNIEPDANFIELYKNNININKNELSQIKVDEDLFIFKNKILYVILNIEVILVLMIN